MTHLDEHEDALRALGLEGVELVPASLVSIPARSSPDVARGLTAPVLDLQEVLRSPRLEPSRESIPGCDVQVYRDLRHENVVVLDVAGGLRLARPGASDAAAIDAHEGAVAVDLRRFRGPAFVRPEGQDELLVLRGADAGGSTTPNLELERLEVAAPAGPTLRADVASWVDADPWLAQLTAERLGTREPLQVALAVGDAWRLRSRRASDDRALLEAVLAGRSSAALEPERTWSEGLDDAAREWLERRGLATMEQLEDALEDALEVADLDVPRWRGWCLALCRRRDELESLLLVLQAGGGGGQALAAALAALDRRGHAVFGGLRRWPEPANDERLRRAAALDPDAWWTAPVRGS